jgi:hypothetical protein
MSRDPGSAGGGRGIRTPGTLSGTAVFKTACFNHSHIPPRGFALVYQPGGPTAPDVSSRALSIDKLFHNRLNLGCRSRC